MTRVAFLDAQPLTAEALDPWPPVDPAEVETGSPMQRGRHVRADAGDGFAVGSWHCTAHIGRMMPYPVDEYMVILAGEVEIHHPDGAVLRVGPGQGFLLPKGLMCRCVQRGPVLKHFLIYDDGTPAAEHSSPAQAAILIDPEADLPPGDPPPAAILASAQPMCGERTLYRSRDGRLEVLQWSATPYSRKEQTAGATEFMHFLKGATEIRDAGGPAIPVATGQSVLVPQGARTAWESRVPVTKVACFFS
jgi:uncharacterized cupin superfamily protein